MKVIEFKNKYKEMTDGIFYIADANNIVGFADLQDFSMSGLCGDTYSYKTALNYIQLEEFVNTYGDCDSVFQFDDNGIIREYPSLEALDELQSHKGHSGVGNTSYGFTAMVEYLTSINNVI